VQMVPITSSRALAAAGYDTESQTYVRIAIRAGRADPGVSWHGASDADDRDESFESEEVVWIAGIQVESVRVRSRGDQ
jgi:hypothetical protein